MHSKTHLRTVLDAAHAQLEQSHHDGDARSERLFVGSFHRDVVLDGLDVIASGLAGALGAAIDLLLVKIPKDVTYLGQYPQAGSVLTKHLKAWTAPSDNILGRNAHVPFDALGRSAPVPGMFPGSHRFMTPGHDPILGLVIGVFDIMRGGRTAIGTDGILRFDGDISHPIVDVAKALVVEFLHLLSDVATKAGLPAPLMTAAGLLRFGQFGENGRTLADLGRYMYLQGYDLRHFVTTCSTPLAIRAVLCGYFTGRKFMDSAYRDECDASARREAPPLQHPKLETMTLLADALACGANIGKIALFHGNPSALDYGQWLALVKSAHRLLSNQLESPTEVLIDRAHANAKVLRRRWEELAEAVAPRSPRI